MPTTGRGLIYPDSTAHVRLWEHIQSLADSAEAALDAIDPAGAWTAFTLTTAGSAGITLGNAVQDCAWRQIDDKTVSLRIDLTLGSTSAIAATVSLGPLPFTVKGNQVGAAWWFRATATQRAGTSLFAGTQVNRISLAADGYYNNTTGGAAAAGDAVRVNGVLELA